MAADSKPSYQLKLDRALDHLKDLEQGIQRFLASDACRAIEKIEPQSGDYVLSVRLRRAPDPALSILVGDCVHSMRCALDHIAYQLATAYTKPLPDRDTQRSEFPVFDCRSKFHERTRAGAPARTSGLAKIAAVDPAAQLIIETMQPYRSGDWLLLLLLHELDRIDKHRRVHLSVATTKSATVTWSKDAPLTFRPPGPVEDGDELMRIPFDPKKHMKPEGHATFEVAFGPGPGERSWVLHQLGAIHALIRERVVPPLLPYLSA